MTAEELEQQGWVKIPGDHSGSYWKPENIPSFWRDVLEIGSGKPPLQLINHAENIQKLPKTR